MAIYIAFIASFNLCIGYVLGVYIGVLPGVKRPESQEEQDEPIALATPAPKVEASPPTPVESAKPTPQAAPSPAAEPQAEPAPTQAPPQQHTNIMEGLEAFKAKLSQVTTKLSDVESDKQAVDECATEVKQANTQYLQKATEALDSLQMEEDGSETQENTTLKVTITQQTAEVRQVNEEIDDIMSEGDPEVARQRLLDSTAQLSESATEAQQAIPTPSAKPDETQVETPGEVDAATPSAPDGLKALDQLLGEIDASLASEVESAPLQVAAVDLEPNDDRARENIEQLLTALESIVAGELTDAQNVAVDDQGRLLLLLSGDSETDANERCERIRQMVAATTFSHEGEKIEASVRCAVADNLRAKSSADIVGRLDESLAEARKLGESRTFHHDGTMAAPVIVGALELEPQEVKIEAS